MPAKPRDKDNPSAFKAALAKAREALARNLPKFTTASFDLGMASAMAAAIAAIASPAGGLDQQALTALMSGLGVNWLSQLIWEWRQKFAGMRDDQRAVQQLAQEILPSLSDARLRQIAQDLDLIKTTLTCLKNNQPALDAVAQEANALGFINKEELLRIARQVNVTISGDVVNSLVVTAGGNVRLNNVTVNIGGAATRVELQEDIRTCKRTLAARLGALDLRGFDVAFQQGEQPPQMESVYTPLYTRIPEPPPEADALAGERARLKPRRPREDLTDELLSAAEKAGRSERVSLIAALNDAPRAVVIGGPGSGKSFGLKHLALGLCGQVSGFDEDWHHGPLLPLHVILRHFARHIRANLAPLDQTHPDYRRKLAEQAQFKDDLEQRPAYTLLQFAERQLVDLRDQPLDALRRHLESYLDQRGAAWLLDGLDEVPADDRKTVRRAIQALAALFPRCRFVVACRPYSYRHVDSRIDRELKIRLDGEAFAELDVLPFDLEQVNIFVHKWYALMVERGIVPRESLSRADELAASVRASPRLRKLSETPLLLTLMASLHSVGNRPLPEDRWELLRQSVDWLLLEWQGRISEEVSDESEQRIHAILRARRDELLESLSRLAFDVHASAPQLDEDVASDIAEDDLTDLLTPLLPPAPETSLTRESLVAYLRDRSGLILDDGPDPATGKHVFRFPHRMFQEYLAARHKQGDFESVAAMLDADFSRWREVYCLIALLSDDRRTAECVSEICPLLQRPHSSNEWRRAFLAAEIWGDKHPSGETLKQRRVGESVQSIHDHLTHLITTPDLLTPAERAEAGRAITLLPNPDPIRFTCADHRHAACANLRTAEGLAEYLANGFVRIEPQDFVMQAGEDNAFKTRVKDAYWIGKTPVTYAQFEPFVEAKEQGYLNDVFWTKAGLEWRGDREAPDLWDDPRWHIANHPVVGVTWYECVAYCKWLTQQIYDLRFTISDLLAVDHPIARLSSVVFRLPSEVEWEFAARGTSGRQYPWKERADEGWVEGDELRCNMSDTGIGRTNAVGMFPNGGTTDGVLDLSGNVWEWCRTTWNEDWRKGGDELEGTHQRVLRGGAFSSHSWLARCAYRNWYLPGYVLGDLGFRVVVRPHLSSTSDR
jgi:formylglycine-generating enzyme required for sulfatase activity